MREFVNSEEFGVCIAYKGVFLFTIGLIQSIVRSADAVVSASSPTFLRCLPQCSSSYPSHHSLYFVAFVKRTNLAKVTEVMVIPDVDVADDEDTAISGCCCGFPLPRPPIETPVGTTFGSGVSVPWRSPSGIRGRLCWRRKPTLSLKAKRLGRFCCRRVAKADHPPSKLCGVRITEH